MASGRLSCGCRRAIVRRKGHGPRCAVYFDMERWNGRVKRSAFRRKLEAEPPFPHHSRGVIL